MSREWSTGPMRRVENPERRLERVLAAVQQRHDEWLDFSNSRRTPHDMAWSFGEAADAMTDLLLLARPR